LLQPLPYLLGILIPSVTARPLGREAPAFQIAADRPLRHADAQFLADQVTDSAARPQRSCDSQFLGLMRAQQTLHLFGLGIAEQTTRTQRTSAAALGKSSHAAAGVGGPPAADRLTGDAEEVSHLDLGETQLAAAQGTQAQRFQDFIG
jgi:hypothetical protein